MRPALRLLQPLEAPSHQLSSSLYVCLNCRQGFCPRPRPDVQSRRNASGNSPFTEKVRRKLWGTDDPPGLKDPYGGEGAIQKTFRKRSQEKGTPEETQETEITSGMQDEEGVLETDDVAPPLPYERAKTWDRLERLGHLGKWTDYPPTEADEYVKFLPERKLVKMGQLYTAAHQTAVELCLMRELKKPLTDVCQILEHENVVFEQIWRCKINPVDDSSNMDGQLVFPNQQAKDMLFFVFEQVGSQSEPSTSTQTYENTEIEEENGSTEEPVENHKSDAHPFFGYPKPLDIGFLSMSLKDPNIKFAFLKRLSQLTGHFIPDSAIASITNIQHAIDYLETLVKPKPKKLAQQLMTNKELQNIPNVQVFQSRRTRIHQDEELGRRKVIEAGLRERGLFS